MTAGPHAARSGYRHAVEDLPYDSGGRGRPFPRSTTAPARRWWPRYRAWRATAAWRAGPLAGPRSPACALGGGCAADSASAAPTCTGAWAAHGERGASLAAGVGGVADLLAVSPCTRTWRVRSPGRGTGWAKRSWPSSRTPRAETIALRPCRREAPALALGAPGRSRIRREGRGRRPRPQRLPLFLAEVYAPRRDPGGTRTTVVRLGQGVDQTGRLHEDAVTARLQVPGGDSRRSNDYGPDEPADRHERAA